MWFITKIVLAILIPYLYVKYEDDLHPTIFVSEYRRIVAEKKAEIKETNRRPGPVYGNCNLCAWKYCSPSIEAQDEFKFNPAQEIHEIESVFGNVANNADKLAGVLAAHSEAHREVILADYKNMNKNKALYEKIADKFGIQSRTGKLMYYLAMPLHEFFAVQFHKAVKDLQDSEANKLSDEDCQKIRIYLLERLISLPNCMLKQIYSFYKFLYKEEFTVGLKSALSNQPETDVIEVYVDLANTPREDKESTNWFLAWKEAKKMRKVVNTHNVNAIKNQFRIVFTKRSIRQIRETLLIYDKLRQLDSGFSSISEDIRQQFQSAKEVFGTMAKIVLTPQAYFSENLSKMLITKTNGDTDLVDFIRTHCGIDLGDICKEYTKKSEKNEPAIDTLKKREQSTGNFLNAMTKIMK